MDVAKKYKDELPRLKKMVRHSADYFETNYKRFNDFRRFVFDSSLTDDDKMVLDTLKKPQIEFNICEAYISRLRGEFSKQEPSVIVMPEDGSEVSADMLDLVKGHLRHIIFDANKNSCEYQVYTDILSGGFSAMKVWTEYAHPMSFDQVIKFDRVYDPTLVGFDPLARTPHKGDGRYCFELYPKTKEEFEEEYPNFSLQGIDFTRSLEGFSWSYSNNGQDVLLLCDFYEKKKKKVKIVQLVNGFVMPMKDYEEFVERWNASGMIEQAPAIKGKPRWTEIETICRWRFLENQVLEYLETDFPSLPIVFVDGNSILIRQGTNHGAFTQMTRPYVYHLKGLQQLKNFAGQTLANELENLVQHKFKVAIESLPDEGPYLDAYTNIQIANTLAYKAFKNDDPKQPIPPPMEIQRIPIPPEVINSFTLVDQMSQSILGSYDASLGINDNQLSGTAIVEGATQSNAAAMPYVVGFMQALSQIARIIVSLIPKYYVTPRTIPVVDEDGHRTYREINKPGQLYMNYDENALNVKVEAGINFTIQKARTLNQIVALSQSMPIFGQFINTQGLKVLIDNLEIQGQEKLKELADEFMQQMAKQQEQQARAQEEAMKNNPQVMKQQNERIKIQLDAAKDMAENKLKGAQFGLDMRKTDNEFLRIIQEMHNARAKQKAESEKAHAEEVRAYADMGHQHRMDHMTHALEISKHIHERNKPNVSKE